MGLVGAPGSLAAGKGTTDASGNVTFKELKPGNYSVELPNAGAPGRGEHDDVR
ncbi:SpaA isopeptide-forming pilin-related protein [Reyranella sp.]|uniref:SpaA isopeptide-forming pilin-related protein n=1 Tax=Reyranella sp. TaxID=1929291 RepID=UPI00351EF6AC